MKIQKLLTNIAVGGIALYAVAREIFSPSRQEAQSRADGSKFSLVAKTVVITVLAGFVVLVLAGLLIMESGVYNIAADQPHFPPIAWALRNGRTRAVKFHSRGIPSRTPREPSALIYGFKLYRYNCQPCHGGPGVAPQQIGRGINPNPPPLAATNSQWTDPQLFWIISHGLKISGMPGFGARLSDAERWAMVAFLRRLAFLTPAEYKRLEAGADLPNAAQSLASLLNPDLGFAQLKNGNPDQGRRLLTWYGCSTCHTIPHVGSGYVGPPLTDFAERQYIAGMLVNVPANAVAWIANPRRFKPDSAMAVLHVNPADAVNIAAYLYTLGSHQRLNALAQEQSQRR